MRFPQGSAARSQTPPAWLGRLAGVNWPLPSDHHAQRAHDRILLDSFDAWCAELRLGTSGSAIAPDPRPLRAIVCVARLSELQMRRELHEHGFWRGQGPAHGKGLDVRQHRPEASGFGQGRSAGHP